ncbi:MAG: serine hydrolase [Lachnospiraceae bacterium]|nr:serine hydrolase [Clostridiales bacterium]MDY2607701.1 serine hydrolase [Lachnospiraceae bacterium]
MASDRRVSKRRASGYGTSRRMSSRQYRRLKRRIQCVIRCTILLLILIGIILGIVFGIKSCTSKHKSNKSKDVKVATSGEIADNSEDNNAANDDNAEDDNALSNAVKYPEKAENYTELTSAELLSPYIAVIDVTNNKLVAGRNAETRIYPASMTKVMTLIVAVENVKSMDDKFTMTSEIIDPLYRDSASRAGFEPGEEVTARDLMYGLILPSGADGAVGLAQMIAGSEDAFVELMNKKCEELGLKNTHFTNTSGLHNENHYTTPVEMAMILEYAMNNETCAKILSTYQYTTEITEKHPEGILLTSTMFSRMYGNEVPGVEIKAGKTGYTQEAKHCLVSYAESDGNKYIAVTAGAEGKWNVIYDDFKLYGDFCKGAGKEAETAGETEIQSQATQS